MLTAMVEFFDDQTKRVTETFPDWQSHSDEDCGALFNYGADDTLESTVAPQPKSPSVRRPLSQIRASSN